ncbi:GNAT family N-acetyltransferase [Paenibacillus sp. IB182496]|uniref:GNAT family N-acetyltransferase n=1 Tax=Paenibacillus sabuli TaxID=2772509 RepID=A0A927GTP1_9BACL|nr:GNAT family N-acetyltransferase [Paenibacillus sabuli]MBD2846902.1 GNAT family N-acetyltransferase [Paenibacillus sabuli]
MSNEAIAIRPMAADDYEGVAAILRVVLRESVKGEDVQEEDAKLPKENAFKYDNQGRLCGYGRLRLVAANPDGDVVGYGLAWRAPWTAPGELNHTLAVLPQARGQGCGGALYAQLEGWASEHKAHRLNYVVREDDPAALSFAGRQGFEIDRHMHESVLQLAGDSGSAGALEPETAAQAPEWTIVPYAKLPEDSREASVYGVYRDTQLDIPGFSGDYLPLSEWRIHVLGMAGSAPEHLFVALVGDIPVGVAHVLIEPESSELYCEFTGVLRTYRGRGIATALKRHCIRHARACGVRTLRTHNDSHNAPMLAINRDRLGFKAMPGEYRMCKLLPRD